MGVYGRVSLYVCVRVLTDVCGDDRCTVHELVSGFDARIIALCAVIITFWNRGLRLESIDEWVSTVTDGGVGVDVVKQCLAVWSTKLGSFQPDSTGTGVVARIPTKEQSH